jgi:3'(2'), 5'-bisphosphate nucleotidase
MTPSPCETDSILREVCRLAEEAGAKAMEFYQGRTSVTLKSDSSPLTEADRSSHYLLVQSLPELIPGVPVISEESYDSGQEFSDADQAFWLVDPLDGTKEFLKGTGEFTVNLALIEDRRPVLGVVYAPALRRIFFARRGKGACRQDHGKAPSSIQVQRADLGHLRVVASKDHTGPLVQAMLARLPNAELKSMGSSLKFCLVAEGAADIYLRDVPTMEWDTAAAQAVVEAAGGTVCTLDGQPLAYGKPGLKNPALLTLGDRDLPWPKFCKADQGTESDGGGSPV